MPQKLVGVIGAGVAGLAAIKCCLEEGLQPVCWEQADDIGGLWNYSDTPKDGFPSVYNSCTINSCKEMVCFSDFPIPKEFPNFMKHRHFKRYLDMYADAFGLRSYIQFATHVEKVDKNIDFEDTGRWVVTLRKIPSGETTQCTVDKLLICNGHLTEPNIPKIKGLDTFQGRVVHTHDYKDFRGFEDKRVLVIGIGNSGSDVACELSRHAEHVFISTRQGTRVVQRAGDFGLPIDQTLLRRWLQDLPRGITRPIMYHRINYKYNHANYSLSPNSRFDSGLITISDDLPNQILVGSITVHADIDHFTQRSAVLKDGSTIKDIDAIILSTGFKFSFPFLDESVVDVTGSYPRLYQQMFPVTQKQRSMAVIGLVHVLGPAPPVLEMQARVATRVMSGKCTLPTTDKMVSAVVEKWQEHLKHAYSVDSARYSLVVPLIDYLDTLAEMIGCQPNLNRLFFKSPKLWYKVYFGPATPPQWRLEGPGKWDGAEKAINSVYENTYFPMKTRAAGRGETDGLYDTWISSICGLLLASIAYYALCCFLDRCNYM